MSALAKRPRACRKCPLTSDVHTCTRVQVPFPYCTQQDLACKVFTLLPLGQEGEGNRCPRLAAWPFVRTLCCGAYKVTGGFKTLL
eukprot:734380-Pelagomonas_calceolata.AAC.1